MIVVECFYILADFLLNCSIICWETGVEVSKYNSGHVFFFLQSVLSVFVSYTGILQLYCLMQAHLRLLCLLDGFILLSLYNGYLLLWVIFFALRTTLSDINIVILAFLGLMFAMIHLLPSLYFKYAYIVMFEVSCRHHRGGSCF